MSNHWEAVGTAFLLVLILSIPSASHKVEYSEAPEDASSMRGPISVEKSTIDIDTEVKLGKNSSATIREGDTFYKVDESPKVRVEVLSKPGFVLKRKITSSKDIYVLESPYGTYRKGYADGRRVRRFRGTNITKLEAYLSDMKNSMKELRRKVREEMLPELEIKVVKSKTSDKDEQVVIENEEGKAIDLGGWTISNSDIDNFEIKDKELSSDERLVLYTEPKSELNVSEDEDKTYIYGTGVDWDSSDKAKLTNSEGTVIDTDLY